MSEMKLSEVLPGAFTSEPPSERARGAARKQRKRKQRKRRRSVVVMLMTLLIVGGAVAAAYVLGVAPLMERLNEPKDYTGAGSGSVSVKVPAGATGRTIARVLEQSGVVKTQVAFLDAAERDPRATSIQPGTYALRRQMSGAAALGLLLDPETRLTLSVTIPEGTRIKDAIPVIAAKLKLDPGDVKKATTSPDIGLPAAAKGRPEGFIFPDTYQFAPDVTATEALTAMVDRGKQVHTELDIPAARLREVVIKASIIQAEAGTEEYMGKVSRVLDNRLKIDMKLRLDSTVSYAVQRFKVTTTPADRASRSRYNTYRYYGLPVGPISNPGEDALRAALEPTPGPWLFFVTTNPGTGETKFATDEAGHEANAREFQEWLRAQPG